MNYYYFLDKDEIIDKMITTINYIQSYGYKIIAIIAPWYEVLYIINSYILRCMSLEQQNEIYYRNWQAVSIDTSLVYELRAREYGKKLRGQFLI